MQRYPAPSDGLVHVAQLRKLGSRVSGSNRRHLLYKTTRAVLRRTVTTDNACGTRPSVKRRTSTNRDARAINAPCFLAECSNRLRTTQGTPKLRPIARDTTRQRSLRERTSPTPIRVSGRGESHPPALAEPCVSLSTHTAPIIQPQGSTPKRQCANRVGSRRAMLCNHLHVRHVWPRSRLYFFWAQRNRYPLRFLNVGYNPVL
jgi:hypothetical protein